MPQGVSRDNEIAMKSKQLRRQPKLDGEEDMKVLHWVLLIVFMLAVFSQTTPFRWDWPVLVKDGVFNETSSAGSIERGAAGNMKRRVGMVVLAGAFLVSLLRTKYRYRINGALGWIVIFYYVWILSSLMWSEDPLYTLRRLVVMYLMWVAAMVIAVQLSFRQLTYTAFFMTGATLLIGVGNELRLGTMNVLAAKWRFSGIFHAVPMGINCGLLMLSSMFLISEEKRPLYRNLLWGVVVVGILFLVLTRTRTAALATILAAGVYWVFLVPPLKKIFLVLGVIICLSAAYVGFGSQFIQYSENASTLGRGAGGKESVANLTGRVPLWKYSLGSLGDRVLQGYGYSTFLTPKKIDQFYQNLGWRPSSLHSAYITAIMGTGVIGLGAFIAMLVLSMTRALSLARHTPEYYNAFTIIVWIATIYITEGSVANGMGFVTFYVLACITKLAFCSEKEWKAVA